MKKTLLTTLLLVFATLANSQSLRLIIDETDYTDSSYTYTTSTNNTNEIKLHIQIANTGSEDVGVLVRKNVISAPDEHVNSFCIGDCYPPNINESQTAYNIAANDTTAIGVFYIEFDHGGTAGQSVIDYTIFERSNNANSAQVQITFNVTGETAIESNYFANAFTAFPNPVTKGMVTFKVDNIRNIEGSRIVVRNILGSTVKTINLNNNSVSLNVDDLPNGIYLYSLEQNGRNIATKRFIIRK